MPPLAEKLYLGLAALGAGGCLFWVMRFRRDRYRSLWMTLAFGSFAVLAWSLSANAPVFVRVASGIGLFVGLVADAVRKALKHEPPGI